MKLLVSCLVFLELFNSGHGHLKKLLPDLKVKLENLYEDLYSIFL